MDSVLARRLTCGVRAVRNAALSRLVAIAALAALVSSPRPAHAGFEGSLSAAAGQGFDSNPRRTVGEEAAGDGLLYGTASGRGRLALGDIQALSGRLEVGAKKFFTAVDEDALVQQLELEYSARLGGLALGAAGFEKLRFSRGGARDYRDFDVGAYADQAVGRALNLRLSGGIRRHLYLQDPGYDALGPRAALAARWAPHRSHVFTAAASLSLPGYAALARRSQTEAASERRRDRILGGQIGYACRGPVALQAAYSLYQVASNSFGESNVRHRLWAAAAGRLPLKLIGSVQVAWELIRYPDGIFLSQDLLLQDDESQSSAAAKLALPLSERMDLELRWALFWISLPARDAKSLSLSYLRQTGGLGVSLRW